MMEDEGTFSTNRPAVVPYDTGKVKIGCRYVPPAASLTDEEMAVQHMLLDSNRYSGGFWRLHGEWAVIVLAALLLIWVIQ